MKPSIPIEVDNDGTAERMVKNELLCGLGHSFVGLYKSEQS